jgi:hypothetical protein
MVCATQQGTDRTASLLHLPKRIAAMLDVVQCIQRTDASQRDKLLRLSVETRRERSSMEVNGPRIVRAARRDSTDELRNPFA